MDECELITLVTAVACALSKCCSNDDITILAAVFTQLGDTLATITTQREIREDRNKNNSENNIGCHYSNTDSSTGTSSFPESNISL